MWEYRVLVLWYWRSVLKECIGGLGRFFPGGLLPSWVEHCWFLGILGVLVGEPFVSALIVGCSGACVFRVVVMDALGAVVCCWGRVRV